MNPIEIITHSVLALYSEIFSFPRIYEFHVSTSDIIIANKYRKVNIIENVNAPSFIFSQGIPVKREIQRACKIESVGANVMLIILSARLVVVVIFDFYNLP